jgi:hypothetical protein
LLATIPHAKNHFIKEEIKLLGNKNGSGTKSDLRYKKNKNTEVNIQQ